ncbi:MAG: HD domain-containing protein [Deltaproteobacteria bacterium]|nr:HD domain-containing protein [Deltaproteobacteria bacterium]
MSISAIDRLNQIGIALSSETDINRLLDLIVTEARGFSRADAGSLYTLEEDRLFFRIAQNDTLEKKGKGRSRFQPIPIPLDKKSIAGYVALTGEVLHIEDVYTIPEDKPYTFNKSFDQKSGYRTQSMLTIPMKEPEGKVLGVLQLINALDQNGRMVPFADQYHELTLSLASQAAVALRNARLIAYIKGLFEALIKYSAQAIDARSPHTAGHSRRVAAYALIIAREMTKSDEGPFAEVRFSPEDLERLSYAAWLHDIGKIGVPEEILDKKWRLPLGWEQIIENRFLLAAVCACQGKGEEEAVKIRRQFTEDCERILAINTKNFLPDEDREFLESFAGKTFTDPDGRKKPLLTEEELCYLSVPRGNLTGEEYRLMQSHVEHTERIVANIPFTGHLKNVPAIASAHHEMLNGTGYPRGLQDNEICLEARILAMVDIFDALTAMDRPYRKAAPPERACAILKDEASRGRLDPDLVDFFVENCLWERLEDPPN